MQKKTFFLFLFGTSNKQKNNWIAKKKIQYEKLLFCVYSNKKKRLKLTV